MLFASATSSVRDNPLEIVDEMLFCVVLFPLVLSKVVISSYRKRAWSKHPRHCIMRATATESDNLVDEEAISLQKHECILEVHRGKNAKELEIVEIKTVPMDVSKRFTLIIKNLL